MSDGQSNMKNVTECAEEECDCEGVVHPDHYNQGNIEVLDFIEDQGHLGFCLQNAIKYICRSGKKASQPKEKDLKRAIYYLEREMGMHRRES